MSEKVSFSEAINAIVAEELDSGAVEAALRKKLDENIASALDDAFRWGSPVRDAIKAKLEEGLVPAIEHFDFGKYRIKLTDALSQIIEQTTLVDNKALLENFEYLMIEPDEKTITLEQLFAKYCRYVEANVDTSELEVDLDERPTYQYVAVHADVEQIDKPGWLSSNLDEYAVHFYTEEDDELTFAVRLHRWNRERAEGYRIQYQREPYVTNLAHIGEFELLLMKLSRSDTRLTFTDENLSDDVVPDAEPEPDWR